MIIEFLFSQIVLMWYYATFAITWVMHFFEPRYSFPVAPRPPRWNEIVPALQRQFLCDGHVTLGHMYLDNRFGWLPPWRPQVNNPTWPDMVITRSQLESIEKDVLLRKHFHRPPSFGYLPQETEWFYQVCEGNDVEGWPGIDFNRKTVCVIGSTWPAFEGFALAKGAAIVYLLEYHPTVSEDPRIIPLQPQKLSNEEKSRLNGSFDLIISFSSNEHSGLGRYGDALQPDDDIKSLHEYRELLKPNGLLLLSVPIGLDRVVWNAHRIYGRHRLPKLLKGWKMLVQRGFSTSDFVSPSRTGRVWDRLDEPCGSYHPLIRLSEMHNPQPTMALTPSSSEADWLTGH